MEMKKPLILIGDCIESMKALDAESIDTCITSPPYWGLRDYGKDEQLGLEETPEEYVQNMVEVFREVKRVLKEDGTLWLNLGDTYAGNNSRASNNGRAGFGNPREAVVSRIPEGVKQKDLVGIPWRVAFALQADGWYLRQDIIWHKPNPMPESVTDRCTKAHEYIFLLSKSKSYYFDYKAIREPAAYDGRKDTKLKGSQKYIDKSIVPGDSEQSFAARGHERWVEDENGVKVRNKRSVWTVPTKPYTGSHFAVFPPELIIPCVLAGSRKGGTVLDPFAGSGTTGQVAIENNRNVVLCELNEEYAKLIHKRLNSTTIGLGL
jgi:site-specific DNA-methyltransferase (adenine-specific)